MMNLCKPKEAIPYLKRINRWGILYEAAKQEEIMLDIKFLRENPDIVKQNIRNKFQDEKLPMVDEVIALDTENRNTVTEANNLRSERNKLSKADRRSDGSEEV